MKILIADDHAIVREGLIGLLRKEFANAEIFEATNGADAMEVARKQQWDLILLDISMPGRNGIDTLIQLRDEGITAPILMLSMQPEDQYAIRVLKAGASGFVNKDSVTKELILAVNKVLSGRKYVSENMVDKLADMNATGMQHTHEQLSNREMQVMQHIASGKTLTEIAREISLSVHTISTYRARILEKLSLNNSAEITRYAMENGLV